MITVARILPHNSGSVPSEDIIILQLETSKLQYASQRECSSQMEEGNITTMKRVREDNIQDLVHQTLIATQNDQ